MTDEELVKWLRNEHRKYVAGTTVTTTGYSQAADRIEALTAENERLREALQECERKSDEPTTVEMIARAALQPQEKVG